MGTSEINELKDKIRHLRKENAELFEENEGLMKRVEVLEALNKELKSKLDEMGKKAGRTRHNKEWMKRYDEMSRYIKEGKSSSEICVLMNISPSTFTRYYRVYKANGGAAPVKSEGN